jgi:hypothetical protein
LQQYDSLPGLKPSLTISSFCLNEFAHLNSL